MIEIRPGTAEDMAKVQEMQQEAFGSRFSEGKVEGYTGAGFLVALSDNELAGFSIFEKDGLILSLTVAKAQRGKGVGSRLVLQTENELRARGVKKVWMHVRENNPYIDFLKDRGYANKGVVPNYYGDGVNAIFIEKEL